MIKKQIVTDAGTVSFMEAQPELCRPLRALLPLGLLKLQSDDGVDTRWGLVVKCGDEQLRAVKFQTMELNAEDAAKLLHLRLMTRIRSIAAYLTHRHRGITIPVVYQRKKARGLLETGLAVFAFPDQREQELPEEDSHEAFDAELGHSATAMALHFAAEDARVWKSLGIPALPMIGVETRTQLELGTVQYDYLIHAQQVFVLKEHIHDQDPDWEILATAGIDEVIHMPMMPLEIPPEQLERSQGRKQWNAQ